MFTTTSTAPSSVDNWSFYDDVNCLNPPAFPIYTVRPTLSNFTPTTTRAGTNESITITGNNFGTRKGEVLFTRDGITSGTTDYLKGLDSTYIESWTNTQIRVKVPSFVRKGYIDILNNPTDDHGSGAGTGRIKIRTARNDSVISSNNLNIEYSVSNYSRERAPNVGPICRVYLARLSNCDDIVFTLEDSFASKADARATTEAALNKWSDLLNLRLVLEKNSDGSYVYVNGFDDSKNVIGFSSTAGDKTFTTLSGETILMATVTSCIRVGIEAANPNSDCYGYFRAYGSHIYINNSIDWDYRTSGTIRANSSSFYETMLHEIGHVLNLGHVNIPADLMYYTTSRSTITNLTSSSKPVIGALSTVNESLNKFWEVSAIGRLRDYNCGTATSTTAPTSAFYTPYPNPAQNSFFINCESISTIKLYDVLGKEVLSQPANGQTEIDISRLPKGIYNVIVFLENRTESNKIVKQ